MKHLYQTLAITFGVIATFFFTGCSANYAKVMEGSESLFYSGEYKKAAQALLPQCNKEGKDQLLFLMEAGLMLNTGKEYKISNDLFLKASDLSDQIATSVSKQAGSFLLNERITNYKGEDFERVLLHMYSGIDFMMLEQYDEARVEFKKVNNLLNTIGIKTGKKYKQNLMAKYLTAIAFEQIAELDNDDQDLNFAYIEYKQIYALNPQLKLVQKDLLRLSQKLGDQEDYRLWLSKFGKSAKTPRQTGELVVLYGQGRGAVKTSRGKLLDDENLANAISLSLATSNLQQGVTITASLGVLALAENPIPKFVKSSTNEIEYALISVNGKDIDRTYKLEDIENTALRNMEDQYKKMYLKVAGSIAVKAAATVASQIAAEKIAEQTSASSFSGLIGAVTGVTVGAGLSSQIKPDLRCWRTLPANLQLGRIYLAPGEYKISVKFVDSKGNIKSSEDRIVRIKEDNKVLLDFRTFI